MSSSHKALIASGTLVLAMLACNIGIKAPASIDPRDAAATVVAATLQAQGLPTSKATEAMTPFASPVPPPSATATVKPTLFISQDNTKCRSGPGGDFKVIASYNNGTILDLIARDTADSYWIVKDPASNGLCWVQVQAASPNGSFESLPEVTPQASTVKVPARPGSLFYNYFCDNSSVTTSLSWAGSADANGYRVYRQGLQVADLPASTTTYNDTANVPFGTQMTFSVEAYNDAGVSPQRSVTFTCK